MYAVTFTIRPVSLYSLRIPYSYQCARIYPLPAPGTLKGLCANALWQWRGQKQNPAEILEKIQYSEESKLYATCRADTDIVVSNCTVSQIVKPKTTDNSKTTNALLRQFAHTIRLRVLLIVNKEELAQELGCALSRAQLYLGDSESLISVQNVSETPFAFTPEEILPGTEVEEINTLTLEKLIQYHSIQPNGQERTMVFYMQDDPIQVEAELHRYIAPLYSIGDDYRPIPSYSFKAAQKCWSVEVQGLKAAWLEEIKTEPEKPKKGNKKKS